MKRFPKLGQKAQRGSKPRCHLFTEGTPDEVAGRLTALVKPYGSVSPKCKWLPAGFDAVEEVELHKPNTLIPCKIRCDLDKWWFAISGGPGPKWDLASQCAIGRGKRGEPGILLVEAKAHHKELTDEAGGKKLKDKASYNSRCNHDRIGDAIEEINQSLPSLPSNQAWGLCRDSAYQMSNRFAWGWKLAELGVPVVLVYLGFLDAIEMSSDESGPFHDPDEWTECVKEHAKGKVPEDAWDQELKTPNGIVFVPRILTVSQPLTAARMPC